MQACCTLCGSENQIAMDAATLCLECGTLATPSFAFPLGVMAVCATLIGIGLVVVKQCRKRLGVSVMTQPAAC